MLESGTLLQNRYEIIEPIGRGGMGAVYLARDQRLGNTIALKETFFNDKMMLAAFEREARLLAGLRHSALPKVMDHFADEQGQFLVMEFIPGADLQDLLESASQDFQTEEVLQWADQILDALDYLHSQNPPVIHRDIKPQNLKLTSRNQIVLLDFGLAKSSAGNSTTTTSGKSLFAYTPVYAPLEQIQGAGTDARSDIYSFGATLYHLLTGNKPVDALSRASAFLHGKPDPLPLVHTQNPRIPAAVSEVIAQAMALNRDLRPATAIVLRKLLRDAAQSATSPTGTQGKTVLSTPQAGQSNVADASTIGTKLQPGAPSATHGQAAVKTGANQARQIATDPKALAPKNTTPNAARKVQRPATSAWPAAATGAGVKESSARGKWLAAVVVLLMIGGIFAWRVTRQSDAGRVEPVAASPVVVEQQNSQPQSEQEARPVYRGNDAPQVQPAATTAQPENVAQPEATPQKVEEPKTATAEPEATPEAAPTEAGREPEKAAQREPQRGESTQRQADSRPFDPRREDERRPPPGMHPPPPGGMPPPPRGGGGPMPERRRP